MEVAAKPWKIGGESRPEEPCEEIPEAEPKQVSHAPRGLHHGTDCKRPN